RPRLVRWSELVVLGAASIWSFETFLYVLACYGAVETYDAWTAACTIPRRLGGIARRTRGPLLAIVVAHVGLSIATVARSGHWPDWQQYLDFILINAPSTDLPTIRMDAWTPWVFVVAPFMLSGLAVF